MIQAGAEWARKRNFRILYDGNAFAIEVYATYDGFSGIRSSCGYYTRASKDGLACVKFTAPGTWFVRVEHDVMAPTRATMCTK